MIKTKTKGTYKWHCNFRLDRHGCGHIITPESWHLNWPLTGIDLEEFIKNKFSITWQQAKEIIK